MLHFTGKNNISREGAKENHFTMKIMKDVKVFLLFSPQPVAFSFKSFIFFMLFMV